MVAKTALSQWGILALVAVLAGCGSPEEKPRPVSSLKLGAHEYRVVDGELENRDASVSGTGALLFRNPLLAEDNKFHFSFSLESGGALQLVLMNQSDLAETFGTQARLKVIVVREGDQLTLGYRADSGEFDLTTIRYSELAKGTARRVSLAVDIHGHGHVIFESGNWREEFATPQLPSGLYWGLQLDKAAVTKLELGASGGHEDHDHRDGQHDHRQDQDHDHEHHAHDI